MVTVTGVFLGENQAFFTVSFIALLGMAAFFATIADWVEEGFVLTRKGGLIMQRITSLSFSLAPPSGVFDNPRHVHSIGPYL